MTGKKIRRQRKAIMDDKSKNGQGKYIIEDIFDLKEGGYFLDIGAHDGKSYSNTWVLEKEFGWKGICIEASEKYKALVKCRSCICLNDLVWDEDGVTKQFYKRGLGSGVVDEHARYKNLSGINKKDLVTKTTKSLVGILKRYKCPETIDLLAIDVEGSEEKIINAELLSKYKFKCICIEIYGDLEKRYVSSLHSLLEKHGYVCEKEMGSCDYIYVLKG